MRKLFLSILLLGAVLSCGNAQTITTFGTSAFSVVGSDFTTTTQDASTLFLSGSATSTMLGSLTVSVPVSTTLSQISLTATQTTNLSDQFQIGIYDSNLNGRLYTGLLSNFSQNNQTTVILSFSAVDNSGTGSPFNGVISSIAFIGAGSVSNTIGITLSSVSAVPEPATYAALFGAASLGFCVWRKRRAA